jgi:hypothetical protein
MQSQNLLDRKHEGLVRSLAQGYDNIVLQAMQAKGYPVEADYIQEHMGYRSPYPGLDRLYHNGQLFLEIVTEFDYSDPLKIRAKQTPTLY